jgi:hypothetical protein
MAGDRYTRDVGHECEVDDAEGVRLVDAGFVENIGGPVVVKDKPKPQPADGGPQEPVELPNLPSDDSEEDDLGSL